MTTGRVLTTPEAQNASHRMGTIVAGPLADDIRDLIAQGDALAEPHVWDGRHAGTFRGTWPSTRTQLHEALQQLGELRGAVERVRTDIVTAGGGG